MSADHGGMEQADLVVLDLDGTLVRLPVDWPEVREELIAIAEAHALDAPLHSVVRLLDAARAAGADAAAAEMEHVVREAELEAVEAAPANRALCAWVRTLPAATDVAVLSLNCRGAVERSLDRAGLGGRVRACVAREDVERHKPHPEGLLQLMERFGADPAATLLVGDSPADHGCARAAGARSVDVADVGVRWERG